MQPGDDEEEESGGGQRDEGLPERVQLFDSGIVDGVVVLLESVVLALEELADGLAHLDGERHPVEEVAPDCRWALAPYDPRSLGEVGVPLGHERLYGLDLVGESPVVPHFLEDVEHPLLSGLAHGEDAHPGHEHVHVLLDLCGLGRDHRDRVDEGGS